MRLHLELKCLTSEESKTPSILYPSIGICGRKMVVENTKEHVTTFEDILEKIGGFGRWNWGMMFLSVLRYSRQQII